MIKIEAYHDGESWCARGMGVDVFTQGDTLDELMANIKEAVSLHFAEEPEVPEVLVLSELKVADAKAPSG